MIVVNGKEIIVEHFPDGTQNIKFPSGIDIHGFLSTAQVQWLYDSDEEIFTLFSVVDWINRVLPIGAKYLQIPYLPNARMDRIKSENENFSLKVFASLINAMQFDAVSVYNVHSNASEALINNIKSIDSGDDIERSIELCNPDVIFFPDEGACKRYSDLEVIKQSNLPVAFGIKKRDWTTGKILGLNVVSDTDLNNKRVLIVDDICSAGGTFKFSAMKLKEMGASDVFLYISHCEDNIQNGDLLKTDLISKIYTTDSILHISNPKIQIIKTFRV